MNASCRALARQETQGLVDLLAAPGRRVVVVTLLIEGDELRVTRGNSSCSAKDARLFAKCLRQEAAALDAIAAEAER